jgi:hypothetical protein
MEMGRKRQFPLEYKACKKAIEQYKARTEAGEINTPCIPHFLSEIGSYPDEFFDVINNPNDKNIPLSVMLKKFGNWCDSQSMQWEGKLKSLTPLLLAQGFSGYKYQAKDSGKNDMKAEITVKFESKVAEPFD